MKVEYVVNAEKEDYSLVIYDLTADQLDAIRIILKTAVDYGNRLTADAEELSLDKLITACWKPYNE